MSGMSRHAVALVATAFAVTNCTMLVGDGDYYIVDGGAGDEVDATVRDSGTRHVMTGDSSVKDASVDGSDDATVLSDDAADASNDVGEASDDAADGWDDVADASDEFADAPD
jgi:hypothetical protein